MFYRRMSQGPQVGPPIAMSDPQWPNKLMFSGPMGDDSSSAMSDGVKNMLGLLAGFAVLGGILWVMFTPNGKDYR